MKGGRLIIHNLGRYPDDEVKSLVKFGLSEIEVKGRTILAIVHDNRTREYRGRAWQTFEYGWHNAQVELVVSREGRKAVKRGKRRPYVIVLQIGGPEKFPIKPFKRNGIAHDYRTWQETLVGLTAHEGKHIQHYHDGSYAERTLVNRRGRTEFRRIGSQRDEPRCEAFERFMLLRFREAARCIWSGTWREPRCNAPACPVHGESLG